MICPTPYGTLRTGYGSLGPKGDYSKAGLARRFEIGRYAVRLGACCAEEPVSNSAAMQALHISLGGERDSRTDQLSTAPEPVNTSPDLSIHKGEVWGFTRSTKNVFFKTRP